MQTQTNKESDSPISLSSLNIKPTPSRIQRTWFGKVRAFNSFTLLEWVYLATALIALNASLGITIERLIFTNVNESDFTFALLLLLTIVFCYLYVIHSIFTERWDELLVFVACDVIVLSYCIVNYMTGTRNAMKLARLALISICSPFFIGVGVLQSLRYFHSNNLIFNTVGASSSLQKSCRMYYVCSSLLKFDFQLQLSMLVLVIGLGEWALIGELEQKIILASGVPVTCIFIIVGFLGLRYENKGLMSLFYILALFEPCYIAYKFYLIITYKSSIDAIYDSTFVCGSFALMIWLMLILCTLYFVFNYFGKGLKEKMFEDNKAPGWFARSSETTLLTPSLSEIQYLSIT